MKPVEWSPEKNEWLKANRKISFDEIFQALDEGRTLAVIPHPNKAKHPHQKMYIVEIDGYAYAVPYVEDEKKIFLKTCFRHRKYTKKYLGR